MTDKYILDDAGNAIPEHDLFKWGRWMSNIQNRRVAHDEIGDGVRVSAVFLALDHVFGGGPPIPGASPSANEDARAGSAEQSAGPGAQGDET